MCIKSWACPLHALIKPLKSAGKAGIVLIVDNKVASWDTLKDFDGDLKSDWMECVSIFKSYGWEWGGDFVSFKDKPHFQKTFGLTTSQLLAKHKAKNFIPNTEYVML